MMLGGTMSGILLWWCLLSIALLLGFAFIVWVLAGKEASGLKLTGQIISVVITVITIILFIYCIVYGGGIRGGMGMFPCGKGNTMQGAGMGKEGMMKEMLKNPEMQKMMKQHMEGTEKTKP